VNFVPFLGRRVGFRQFQQLFFGNANIGLRFLMSFGGFEKRSADVLVGQPSRVDVILRSSSKLSNHLDSGAVETAVDTAVEISSAIIFVLRLDLYYSVTITDPPL
jgi:hypothetical protein